MDSCVDTQLYVRLRYIQAVGRWPEETPVIIAAAPSSPVVLADPVEMYTDQIATQLAQRVEMGVPSVQKMLRDALDLVKGGATDLVTKWKRLIFEAIEKRNQFFIGAPAWQTNALERSAIFLVDLLGVVLGAQLSVWEYNRVDDALMALERWTRGHSIENRKNILDDAIEQNTLFQTFKQMAVEQQERAERLEVLVEQSKQLSTQAIDVQKALNDARAEQARIEAERNQIQQENARLQEKARILQQQLETQQGQEKIRVQKELVASNAEIEKLQKRIGNLDTELQALREQNENLDANLKNARLELEQFKGRLNEAGTTETDSEQILRNEQTRHRRAIQHNRELSDTLKKLEAEKAEYDKQLEKLQRDNDELVQLLRSKRAEEEEEEETPEQKFERVQTELTSQNIMDVELLREDLEFVVERVKEDPSEMEFWADLFLSPQVRIIIGNPPVRTNGWPNITNRNTFLNWMSAETGVFFAKLYTPLSELSEEQLAQLFGETEHKLTPVLSKLFWQEIQRRGVNNWLEQQLLEKWPPEKRAEIIKDLLKKEEKYFDIPAMQLHELARRNGIEIVRPEELISPTFKELLLALETAKTVVKEEENERRKLDIIRLVIETLIAYGYDEKISKSLFGDDTNLRILIDVFRTMLGPYTIVLEKKIWHPEIATFKGFQKFILENITIKKELAFEIVLSSVLEGDKFSMENFMAIIDSERHFIPLFFPFQAKQEYQNFKYNVQALRTQFIFHSRDESQKIMLAAVLMIYIAIWHEYLYFDAEQSALDDLRLFWKSLFELQSSEEAVPPLEDKEASRRQIMSIIEAIHDVQFDWAKKLILKVINE